MTDRLYVNQIFEDTTIELGGLKAIDVIFNRCTLTYSGGDAVLDGCDFMHCTFVFPNEELRTEFIEALNDAKAGNKGDRLS